MKKSVSFTFVFAILVAFLPTGARFGGTTMAAFESTALGWDVACNYQYTAAIDPIVMADGQPSGHLHDFFGAEVTDRSTRDSLRTANADNCTHVDDESGYWFPAFYDRNGNKVQPRQAKAYYRVAPKVDPNLIQPWPEGLELVAGNHMAVTGQTMDGVRRAVRWFCGGVGNGETALADLPGNCTDPNYPHVGVTVVFPNCTVEQITPRDDLDHKSHMAYSNPAGQCPASHPRHVPRLGLLVTYNISDGAGGYIDSNMQQPERTAYGMHADFMDGWTQERVAALIEGCMRSGPIGCGPVRTKMLYSRVVGPGTVREVTPAARLTCTAPITTPSGSQGASCPLRYGLGDTISLEARPAPGYRLAGWYGVAEPRAVRCDGADESNVLPSGRCTFRLIDNLALEARFVEATPPETTITGGPPPFVKTAAAGFTFSANETGATFECALDGGTFAACTSGQAFGDLVDGPHTLDVRAIDLAGNVDATPARRAWQVDTVVPSGGITINAGAEVATTRNATLTLTATDPDPASGVTEMRLHNLVQEWGPWQPFATSKPWTLTEIDGTKTIEAEFRDAAGNVSATTSDQIALDIVEPSGALLVNDDADATRTTAVTLTLEASAGTTEMRLHNFAEEWSQWEPFAPTKNWTLTSVDGVKTIEAEFRDGNGVVSATVRDEIRLDTAPPSGSIAIEDGAGVATSRNVTLTLSADAETAAMRVRNVPGGDWSAWEAFEPSKAWTLPVGDGPKTVEAQFADFVSNLSDQVSDDIRLDVTGPTGTVTIDDDAPVTRSSQVTLALRAEAGPTEMRFRNAPDGDWSAWRPYAPQAGWTLPTGDGPRQVLAQFRDAAGNLSAEASDSIRLDTLAPRGSLTINGGADTTASREVTLALTTSDDTIALRLRNDAAEWSVWLAVAPNKTWTLSPGNGAKQVSVQLRDAAGNDSVPITDTIRLDVAGPSGTVAINGTAALTNAAKVTLNLNAAGATAMRLRNGTDAWTNWRSYTRQSAWTLAAGDGVKTVAAEFKDAAGNVSSLASDTIRLDTAAPRATIQIDNGAGATATRTVTLHLTATDPAPGSGPTEMRFRNGPTGAWSAWRPFAATASWSLTDGNGNKQVIVQVRDAAGNLSPETSDAINYFKR